MKQYTKGIITGLIISAVIAAVPTLAANIDALLNPVRININGVDTYQWGDNIELDNGTQTPSSILYNGTTYLPMRKLGELMDKQIYWNGDTQTVSMTGKQSDVKVVVEKPDANGNVWTYYTFKDEKSRYYLGVKDEARGFERVYLMPSESVRVTDNEIYFVRLESAVDTTYGNLAYLMKITFGNDIDSQDGEILKSFNTVDIGSVIFVGNCIYYTGRTGGTSGHGYLKIYNYITGTEQSTGGASVWSYVESMGVTPVTETKVLIQYLISHTSGFSRCSVMYDEETNEFSDEEMELIQP